MNPIMINKDKLCFVNEIKIGIFLNNQNKAIVVPINAIKIPILDNIRVRNPFSVIFSISNDKMLLLKIDPSSPIMLCFINKNNITQINPVIRIKDLDEIQSPYTSGLLDEFFDGRLSPMIQTNRGCPFSCTFCTDGSDLVKQVNKFSIKRVEDELEYISKKVPKIDILKNWHFEMLT